MTAYVLRKGMWLSTVVEGRFGLEALQQQIVITG